METETKPFHNISGHPGCVRSCKRSRLAVSFWLTKRSSSRQRQSKSWWDWFVALPHCNGYNSGAPFPALDTLGPFQIPKHSGKISVRTKPNSTSKTLQICLKLSACIKSNPLPLTDQYNKTDLCRSSGDWSNPREDKGPSARSKMSVYTGDSEKKRAGPICWLPPTRQCLQLTERQQIVQSKQEKLEGRSTSSQTQVGHH